MVHRLSLMLYVRVSWRIPGTVYWRIPGTVYRRIPGAVSQRIPGAVSQRIPSVMGPNALWYIHTMLFHHLFVHYHAFCHMWLCCMLLTVCMVNLSMHIKNHAQTLVNYKGLNCTLAVFSKMLYSLILHSCNMVFTIIILCSFHCCN